MRRNEREITDISQIEKIIRKSNICRLGLCENNRAYIVPLNFGYRDRALYFHSAPEGRKIELLKANPDVCFEFDVDLGLVKGENGCDWSIRYQSVIGTGRVEFIDGTEAKRNALDILMSNYSEGQFDYPFSSLQNILIFRVNIESVTGKQSI